MNGSGQVVMDDLAPNAALTGATAFGAEDGNGYPENWVVIANAICATPPAGLQLVTATSPTNSTSKGVTATCPTGKRVLGTGADLAGGLGQVVLDDIAPNAGLTAVTAFGAEDGNGTSNNWTIRAFAVCANPVAGLQRVATTSASSSAGTGKLQSAACPTGKDLLGVGGELTGGAGQVVIDELNPAAELTTVDVFAKEDEDGQAANWSLTAYAICANGSHREMTEFEDGGTVGSVGANTLCPTARALTGGGFELTGGLGRVLVRISAPAAGAYGKRARLAKQATTTRFARTRYAPPRCQARKWSPRRAPAIRRAPSPSRCPAPKASGWWDRSPHVRTRGSRARRRQLQLRADGRHRDGQRDRYRRGRPVGGARLRHLRHPAAWLAARHGLDPLDEEEIKSVTATCPAGKNLLGTGVEMPGAGGRVAIDDLRPNALLTANTVTGIETELGNPNDWSITAYAICANP